MNYSNPLALMSRIPRLNLPMLLLSIFPLGCAAGDALSQQAPITIPEHWGELELQAAIDTCTSKDDLSYRAELRRKMLDLRPNSASLQIDLGRDLLDLGHYELAESLFHAASSSPEFEVFATMELAHLQELNGRLSVAAALLEQKANSASISDRRMLLEKASRLRQKDGDMQTALANLEMALKDVNVSEGERRLLEQMQAFQRGEFTHTDDAIKVFRQHANLEMRLQAGKFLGGREFPNSAAVFADVLTDSNPAILLLAISELSQRGESMDSEPLLPLLDHPDTEIKVAATSALGKLDAKDAIPVLLDRLDPQNRILFRAQNLALERLSGVTISSELDAKLEQRIEIADTWADWWNESD